MKKISYILSVFMLVLLLGACSQKVGTTTDNKTTIETDKLINISGVLGDLKLEQPAKKVVALEWSYAEDLLAVGVQPVGIADIENYNKWVNIEEKLDENVVDVGGRVEPNLEKIAELKPDLIIAAKSRHEGIKSQLESIAPTVFFGSYDNDKNLNKYDEMELTFIEIAKAVGKPHEAEQVLSDLNSKYEEAKASIEASNLSTKDVLLAQSYTLNQAPEIRLFTPNSLASVVAENIGLNNIYIPNEFQPNGFNTVNVEALTNYENANYIYIVQDDDNIYENQLKNNQIWNGLNFVKENRSYSLGGDTWLFGGPLSAKALVERIVNTLEIN